MVVHRPAPDPGGHPGQRRRPVHGLHQAGVTTIFDHHASFCEIPGSLFAIAESAKKFGVRSCLCYEVSDRDGQEKADQAVRENEEFITYCEKIPAICWRPCSADTHSSPSATGPLRRWWRPTTAAPLPHPRLRGDERRLRQPPELRRRPVQRLQDHGILGPKTILGHCIHVNTAEMEIIQATGTMCVNNPESNMGNAVGCSPVLQLMKRGITVGLGTDAYTNDMLESLKVALAIQRHNACPCPTWAGAR